MEPPEDLLTKEKNAFLKHQEYILTWNIMVVASFHVFFVALSHEYAISVDCAVRPLASAAEHGISAWVTYSSKVHRYN